MRMRGHHQFSCLAIKSLVDIVAHSASIGAQALQRWVHSDVGDWRRRRRAIRAFLVAAPVIATLLWLTWVSIGGGKCVFQVFGVSGEGGLMAVHDKAMTTA
jgi:hypothetical protein